MTMRGHEPFEELISASLNGDLTDAERASLDAHLDACAACRATLATFAEGRRIVGGLRHLAPPRDLGARVRTGIERGAFADIPWWRRPAAIFTAVGGGLAAVTGVLLALVLLNGPSEEPPVGGLDSPTPSASISLAPTPTEEPVTTPPPPTVTPQPEVTLPPAPGDPSPSAPVDPTPTEAPQASPSATPSPEPDVFVAVTGPQDNLVMTLQEPQPTPSPSPVLEIPDAPSGPPIAAAMSPDGTWLAYVTEVGLRGVNEVRVTRLVPRDPDGPAEGEDERPLEEGETAVLGETLGGTPFLERLLWSPDGTRLAFTLAEPGGSGDTDVWIFDVATEEAQRLTENGRSFAASWVTADDEEAPAGLWISLADETPSSHLVELPADEAIRPIRPANVGSVEADGVFLPTLSPNGRLAIYWTGTMARDPEGLWRMADGGQPFLSEHDAGGGESAFPNERPLFSDLTQDREMFSSAAIAWGSDGDAYAVWDARWTGEDQGNASGGPYPDAARVYFGHATDARGLTRDHAIDRDDLRGEGSVVDVQVSPTGRHLVLTVRRPVDGDLSPPRADLLLVTRNTGSTPDDVEVLNWTVDEGWFGPALFEEDLPAD